MENFVLYDEIEKTNEQVIYKARRKGTIKYLAVACAEKHKRPVISNHVRVSHELKHKNVLQFYEWYETSNHLWLVMELCTGGSLEQVIKEDRFLSENVVRKFGADIVRGLRYVHSRGVVFNRLLPSRFLLDGNGTVKLFDFSLAHAEDEILDDLLVQFCEEDDYNQGDFLRGLSVHSEYDSPETISQYENSKSSDYWGLGCLFYNMFFGHPPFSGGSQEELDRNILNREPNYSNPNVSIPPSSLFKSLLTSLLTKSSSKRISENDLIKHSFWHQRISVADSINSVGDKNGLNQASVDKKQIESECYLNGKTNSTTITSFPSKNSEDTPKLSHYNEKSMTTIEGNEKPQSFDSAISNSDASLSSMAPLNDHVIASNDQSVINNSNNLDKFKMKKNSFSSNDRMVQSEYHTSTSNLSQMEMSTCKSLHLRANLALIYPWGDDSISFPRETKSIAELWSLFTNNNNNNSPIIIDSDQKKIVNGHILNSHFQNIWKPKPLSDYLRWGRVMPPTKIEGLTRLYNPISLNTISLEELEQHICEVVNLFRTRSFETTETLSSRLSTIRASPNRTAIKSYRTNLLAYLIWLMAKSNSINNGKRRLSAISMDIRSYLTGIQLAPDLLIELTKQLRSGSALPNDVRTGLCRLCSLISYYIALFLIQLNQCESDKDPLNLISHSTGSLFSNCLTVLIDIIRESSSRCGLRLRQAAVIALGEVLTCSTCLLLYAHRKSSTISIDTQAIQWQTAVHHLIRLVTSTTSISTSNLGSNSANNEPTSILDAFDGAAIRNLEPTLGSRNSFGNEENSHTTGTVNTKITESHIRLSASKSLDAFVTAIHGCQLYDISVSGSLSESITSCLHSITTGDIVSRLWSQGIVDSSTNRTGVNPIQQELTLSCASTLAGIIRLNPNLFTTGLIDRVGSSAFIGLIEPPASGLACQQTDLVARLLSTAAAGLLIPLFMKRSSVTLPKVKRAQSASSKLSRTSVNNAGGAGTPAACKRLLSEQKFINTIFRHLESPHAMIRAKAFLLSSAIIANSPQDTLSVACHYRLPTLLERNLKATRTLNHRYNDAFDYSLTKSSNISSSSGQNTESPCTVYLAACVTHMADILVCDIIPTICYQILSAVGCLPLISSGCGPIRLKLFYPHDLKSSGELNNKECHSTTNLSASGVVTSSSSSSSGGIPSSTIGSGFCVLSFASRLLEHWTSADPVSVAAGLFSIHHTGSFEDEILSIVLTIIEDISQQTNLVEKRKQDLICLILPGLARLAVCSNTKPEVRSICVKIITNLASVFLGESDLADSTASLVELEHAYSVTSIGHEDPQPSIQLRKYGRTSSAVYERPVSADADVLLGGMSKTKKTDRMQNFSNLNHVMPSRMTTSQYTLGRDPGNKSRGSNGNKSTGVLSNQTRVKNNRIDPNQNPDCIGSAIQPPSPDVLLALFDLVNKLLVPYGNSVLTCPEITAPTAFLRLLCILLKCASQDCYTLKYSSSNNTLVTSNSPYHANSSKHIDSYDSTKEFIQQLISDETHLFITNFSTYGLDISLVRLLASQLLSSTSSSPSSMSLSSHASLASPLCTGSIGCSENKSELHSSPPSVTSNLCLTLFELIPLLFHWSNICKPDYLIIKLRLLELVTIACLEIGQILVPEPNSNSDEKQSGNYSNKSHYNSGKHSGVNHRIPRRYKSPLNNPSTRSECNHHSIRLLPATDNVCIPMLAALGALNALLNYVADVVRLALASRAANSPDAKNTAVAAEEILIAARPHPKLAGLLARLIGLWRPHQLPTIQPNVCESDLHNWTHLISASIQEQNYEDGICFRLCEASITALTNYASLYGGEYSRSALIPSSTDPLSLGLLRLAEEDQLLQIKYHVSKETLKNSYDSFNSKRSTYCRRRMRLLLRIIRRLVFSDPVCRSRLDSTANSMKCNSNLFTTLKYLLVITQRSADASTSKLLKEITDLLSPKLHSNHNRNAISSDRSYHSRSGTVQPESSSNRIISKAVA
ncbi:protein kinase [Schistosoma mansoni]|uniref:protein kinase n=1 Tax=Schistosoma mansoni TaxID=6183 RepID=UPI0001A640DC|nr:protein kinase [Schistosoma mansoni]|eukprot:XP_018652026.1 protein kinase [Schistosoma mansoni]